MIECAVHDL
jgi:hypothetical protein